MGKNSETIILQEKNTEFIESFSNGTPAASDNTSHDRKFIDINNREAGLPSPMFKNISDGFMVTIYSSKSDYATKDATKGATKNATKSSIQKKILKEISLNKFITYEELSKNFNRTTIYRNIKELRKDNTLEKSRGRKYAYFTI